jgi:HrpA-like RNA helicase
VLKQAQKERRIAKENPLRLILMSATMDVEELYEYLQKPKLYYVRGRTHIVKV